MYKLNILKAHQFFDLITPVNFLVKKRHFAAVKEIHQSCNLKKNHSFPHNFRLKEEGGLVLIDPKQYKKSPKHIDIMKMKQMKQIDFSWLRNSIRQRANTHSPSKKWKIYKNLPIVNNRGDLSPKKMKTFIQQQDDSKQSPISSNSFDQRLRSSSKQITIYSKLPSLLRLKSKEIEKQESLLLNTSLQKIEDAVLSPIQSSGRLICPTKSQNLKFLTDSYRLYGLEPECSTPINKFKMQLSKICQATESRLNWVSKQEIKCRTPKSQKSSPKYGPKDLLKLSKLTESSTLKSKKQKTQKTPIKYQSSSQNKDRSLIISYFPDDSQKQIKELYYHKKFYKV